MKITLFIVGKLKSREIKVLLEEYSSRIVHYTKFEVMPVKDEKQALTKISPSDHFIALDERGKLLSSVELAEVFDKHKMRGTKNIAILIGGENGLGTEIKERANMRLSLSKMTFPHELVSVIIAEQIYRAFSILKGEPYHRA